MSEEQELKYVIDAISQATADNNKQIMKLVARLQALETKTEKIVKTLHRDKKDQWTMIYELSKKVNE